MVPLVLSLVPGRAVGPFSIGCSLDEVNSFLSSRKIDTHVILTPQDDFPSISISASSLGLVFVFHPHTQRLVQILIKFGSIPEVAEANVKHLEREIANRPPVYVEYLGTHIPVVVSSSALRQHVTHPFETAQPKFGDIAKLLLHPLVVLGQESQTDCTPQAYFTKDLGVYTLKIPGLEAHFNVNAKDVEFLELPKMFVSKNAPWMNSDLEGTRQSTTGTEADPDLAASPLSWLSIVAKPEACNDLKLSILTTLESAERKSVDDTTTKRITTAQSLTVLADDGTLVANLNSTMTSAEAAHALTASTKCSFAELPMTSLEPATVYSTSTNDNSQTQHVQVPQVRRVLVCPSLGLCVQFTDISRLKCATIYCNTPLHAAFLKHAKAGLGLVINGSDSDDSLPADRLENLMYQCTWNRSVSTTSELESGDLSCTITPVAPISDTLFTANFAKRLADLPCRVTWSLSRRCEDFTQAWSSYPSVTQALHAAFEQLTSQSENKNCKDGGQPQALGNSDLAPTLFVQDNMSSTGWEFTIRSAAVITDGLPSARILLQLAAFTVSFED